jgi:hypothetical protein
MLQCSWDEAADGASLDHREGIGSEGRVLPYEPVHGGLKWAAHTAHRCVPLMSCRGQICGDPVYQHAPESWTGLACRGPFFYRKVIGFDVFNLEFMGLSDR